MEDLFNFEPEWDILRRLRYARSEIIHQRNHIAYLEEFRNEMRGERRARQEVIIEREMDRLRRLRKEYHSMLNSQPQTNDNYTECTVVASMQDWVKKNMFSLDQIYWFIRGIRMIDKGKLITL